MPVGNHEKKRIIYPLPRLSLLPVKSDGRWRTIFPFCAPISYFLSVQPRGGKDGGGREGGVQVQFKISIT
jgi:hypothetical protein